jgi:hypothetical protein
MQRLKLGVKMTTLNKMLPVLLLIVMAEHFFVGAQTGQPQHDCLALVLGITDYAIAKAWHTRPHERLVESIKYLKFSRERFRRDCWRGQPQVDLGGGPPINAGLLLDLCAVLRHHADAQKRQFRADTRNPAGALTVLHRV